MLEAAVRDRPLAFLHGLVFVDDGVEPMLQEAPCQVRLQANPPVRRRREEPAEGERVGVVHGDDPGGDMRRRLPVLVGDAQDVGQPEIGVAHVVAADRPHVDPVVGLLDLEPRHRLRPQLHRRMGESGVHGIRVVFQALEVIAIPGHDVRVVHAVGALRVLGPGKGRRLPGAHIRKD